jgi:hypothetical protein
MLGPGMIQSKCYSGCGLGARSGSRQPFDIEYRVALFLAVHDDEEPIWWNSVYNGVIRRQRNSLQYSKLKPIGSDSRLQYLLSTSTCAIETLEYHQHLPTCFILTISEWHVAVYYP